jgi:hypothetical protein
MELKGVLKETDLRAAAWMHIAPRRTYAVLGLLVVAIAIWALWLAFFGPQPDAGWSKWVVLAFLVFLPAHYFLYAPYRLRRQFRQFKALQREQFLTTTDSGLTTATEHGSATVPWSDLLRWKEGNTLFMLYVADCTYYLVPKRFFASEADIQGFRKILQSKVARR